ncbi:MAG: rhomboid family intramembrane serine protease [Armatimonadota bacterium]|nr:rhomboid family intramembrane serine protease [Armatimonadota bacterium]MDR7438711.1 rhomboid family intramembrane serine protease [Armatimonadota bacterium]MDR7561927.1 rhomboid family intramembrane serine protease [Armatimonadota bacterium]MDR7601838.1 rhomboid family intramembrane serine protease [Armatimonadota bacterium]
MYGRSPLPGDCPLTWALVLVNLFTFLLDFLGFPLSDAFAFNTLSPLARPWSFLTYPLVGADSIVGLLLGAYVFWLLGGSLERAWGGRDYLLFLGLTILATALGLWIGAALLNRVAVLAGLWMPVAAVTVAWATLNPYERLLVYFAIPVEGRWLGLVAAVIVFFSFQFPLGAFALGGCGVAWWYARGGRYVTNPLEAYRRWRRRREFRRLWDRDQ